MKNIGLSTLLLLFIVFGSCKKNQGDNEDQKNKVIDEKPISVECYQSIYENDTINLSVNVLKSGGINGDMLMKLENMPIKNGKIAGEFRGDTLFVAYTFFQGENTLKTFKNPMAFLKRGEELILGNGKIEMSMGASYFVKGEPIDFERVKYIFSKVECPSK